MEGTTLQKNRRYTVSILIIILLVLLIAAKLSQWHTAEVTLYWQDEPERWYYSQVTNGMDHYVHTTDWHNQSEIQYTIPNSNILGQEHLEGSANYNLISGISNLNFFLIPLIICGIVLLATWLYGNKKDKFKIPLILALVISILLGITLASFYLVFPYGDPSEVPTDTFIGSYSSDWRPWGTRADSAWGPDIGFYFALIAFILAIISFIIIFKIHKSQRPEQVGEGQRRDARLGEEEGKNKTEELLKESESPGSSEPAGE